MIRVKNNRGEPPLWSRANCPAPQEVSTTLGEQHTVVVQGELCGEAVLLEGVRGESSHKRHLWRLAVCRVGAEQEAAVVAVRTRTHETLAPRVVVPKQRSVLPPLVRSQPDMKRRLVEAGLVQHLANEIIALQPLVAVFQVGLGDQLGVLNEPAVHAKEGRFRLPELIELERRIRHIGHFSLPCLYPIPQHRRSVSSAWSMECCIYTINCIFLQQSPPM